MNTVRSRKALLFLRVISDRRMWTLLLDSWLALNKEKKPRRSSKFESFVSFDTIPWSWRIQAVHLLGKVPGPGFLRRLTCLRCSKTRVSWWFLITIFVARQLMRWLGFF